MNKKILLGIAILAIGLVVFPQTVAMFVGQHNFYDTVPTTNIGVPCEKCHSDITTELNQPGQANAFHLAQGCAGCHITTAPLKRNVKPGPGNQFHAAAAPACIDCHGGTGPGLSALEILTGSEEVHKPFANQSKDAQFLKDSNEACISCHTHIRVNITWQKATTIEFSANETVLANGNHSWIVGKFNATGVNITKTSG